MACQRRCKAPQARSMVRSRWDSVTMSSRLNARLWRSTLRRTRTTALSAALLAVTLQLTLGGSVAQAKTSAVPTAKTVAPSFRFVPGKCPVPPSPIPELGTARCGQLIVPEDRRHPSNRTISLSVAIISSKSPAPKPDPIIWLAGGPGDDAIAEIPMALAGDLNADHNVIFMAQRGTSTAQPFLTCPEVDRLGADTLNLPYDGAVAERAHVEATKACRSRLTAQDADLAAYNTLESADDLNDLRLALGIHKWDVFGISYGTDLALNYMRMYPQGIRSVGIDGVFPPPLSGGVAAWTSASQGIKAVFAACATQQPCRARYGDIGATFRHLVLQYERSPKSVSVTVPGVKDPVRVMISGGMLVQWAVSPGTHTAAEVPAAIDALAHGDPGPVASTWAAIKLNPAAVGGYGNGLYYSISCGEWVPYETEASVIATGRRAFPTFPKSVLMNAPNLQFMRPDCGVWNKAKVPSSVRAVTRSKIPTLVMSSQYDGQTAASFGRLVAKSLPNSTVVTIPNIAHVAFSSPSPVANACAQGIVRSFFDVLNGVNTSCAAAVPPTSFVITPPHSEAP